MKLFQVTIAAGKDVKDVEANAAGSEQDKDAKNKKVIFDWKKTIIILVFSLRLIRERKDSKVSFEAVVSTYFWNQI